MDLILTSFSRALGQLSDPRFRRVVLMGVGITIAALAAMLAATFWLVSWLLGDGITLPWIGTIGWTTGAASWGSVAIMGVVSAFMMAPLAIGVQSLFLEQIARAVEDRHYPRTTASPVPLSTAVSDGIRAFMVLLGINLLALVFYLFTGPFAPFIFYALNGFVLGREYIQVSALRHLGPKGARTLRRRHLPTIWAAGILMAVPLTVPIINLFVPVLGAATFTHIFHGLNRPTPDQV